MNDIWTIIFTSGTTGDPKGAVLDYKTVYLTKIIIESEVNPLKVDRDGNNSFISYMPLNHIFERVVIEFHVYAMVGLFLLLNHLNLL